MFQFFARLGPEKIAINGIVRWSSSQKQTLSDSVKGRLRELYKRVHPDYFHHDPTAKVRLEQLYLNYE